MLEIICLSKGMENTVLVRREYTHVIETLLTDVNKDGQCCSTALSLVSTPSNLLQRTMLGSDDSREFEKIVLAHSELNLGIKAMFPGVLTIMDTFSTQTHCTSTQLFTLSLLVSKP